MKGGRRTRKAKNGKSKTMRGGAVEPSFGGTIGTAGPLWTGASTAGAYSSETGGAIADPTAPQTGGRRRRHKNMYRDVMIRTKKTKGGRRTKGRRTKGRRTMRGGASQYLPATANAGFSGTGSRGMADFTDVSGSAPRANGVLSA
jgi:hypothetical protein